MYLCYPLQGISIDIGSIIIIHLFITSIEDPIMILTRLHNLGPDIVQMVTMD